jgi:G3E family GTPase
LDRHQENFEFKSLFDTSLYDPETKSMDVRKWLNAGVNTPANDRYGDVRDIKNHHHHDITRHGSDIRSFTLTFDDPVTIETLASSLEALCLTQGANILRVKGIVNTVDRPGYPLVVHGVQHIFHDPVWLNEWPNDNRQTQLVFITVGVARESLEIFFKSWISTSNGVWR